MTPLLPKLKEARLFRFEPLFSDDIKITIPKDLFLVAGGNGLGKTTIMQAIVYCIAGELDLTIEKNKSKRWGSSYFHGRLEDYNVASVEVKFSIGGTDVVIRRGFKSKNITHLSINGDKFTDLRETDIQYDEFITEECGYQSLDDFRFVFHKLCYLPETRPDLAWDLDTQIRILMNLFADELDENQFRTQRENLKKLDSKRRHINVAINKAKVQIASLLSYDEDDNEDDEDDLEQSDDAEIEVQMNQLAEIYKDRLGKQKELRKARKSLSNVTIDVENLEDQLSEAREAFFLGKLAGFESQESRMAMHKLLFLKLCPACGSKSKELSKKAEILSEDSCCPLCGADEKIDSDVDLPQLDAELNEKMALQVQLEKRVLRIEALIDHLNNKESGLQTKIDKYRIANPVVSDDCAPKQEEEGELKKELQRLKRKHTSINIRFRKLQNELDTKYNDFKQTTTIRLKKLNKIYQMYATYFLGVQCDLDEVASGDKFLDLNLFVPRFEGKKRTRPEMCSEAQRFFLDIAFRLALIDLDAQLTDSKASFLCETPENSLDISYIENVAKMFRSFSDKGHTMLLTTNIQPGGLAKPILRGKKKREKSKCILNLLDYGHLSNVQKDNIKMLNEEFKAILSGK